MNIGTLCKRISVLATPGETALAAAQRMVEHKVGSLVVVNDLYQPIGIVTDRDLMKRVMAESKEPKETLLREVMTKDPRTIVEDAPIETALTMMRTGGFRRMPVVGTCQRLVGVVTLDDVMSLFAEEFTKIGGLLEPGLRGGHLTHHAASALITSKPH